MKYLFFVFVLFTACKSSDKDPKDYFEIGVIADCQYCNCESTNRRFYRAAKNKLELAVDSLNSKDLDFTIHLGDFIDRDFNSFDTVLPIWNSLKSEKRHVLGNHDFSVADSLKNLVPKKMGMLDRYYSFKKQNWRFIVLDGNDLSYYGATSDKVSQTDSLFNSLKNKDLPNIEKWNGGLSNDQLNWIKEELELSRNNKENVGFYCHFPAAKYGEMHNLWNYKQFLTLIESFENIKFYFSGHNHNGDYVKIDGVHHLTFRGMLDTPDSTAFSIVKFTKDSIIVKGHGREISRDLKIK